MSEFKMNLDGVTPSGVNQYIEPGEYRARISGSSIESTEYGNAARFNFQILEANDEGQHKGARIDTLLYIPDDEMDKKTSKHEKAKTKKDWAGNFMGFMASKWVSLMQATGLGEAIKDGVDARAVAKKVTGVEMVIIVQDSKKRKPTDPVFSQVNGFLPADSTTDGDVALSDDTDEDDDSFDLDEL